MKRLPILLAAFFMAAIPALAQDGTSVVRDGSQVTVTLPDGSVQTLEVSEDAPVRIVVRNGAVVVEEEGVRRERRIVMRSRDTEDIVFPDRAAIEAHVDSLLARIPVHIEERAVRIGGADGARIRFERARGASPELRREMAEAERDSRRLALEVRRAERTGDTTEAQRLRTELRQTLQEAFDLREQVRREQLDALRQQREELAEQMQELSQELEQRQQHRADIIERRERELIGERDELDW